MIAHVAAALTWDGARCPARSLPAKARTFLGPITPVKRLAGILAEGSAIELRICWVPTLRGGDQVLCPPFMTTDKKRIPFRLVRTVAFGDVLGTVYRRG